MKRQRINQINARITELDNELNSANASRIGEIETEVRTLTAERETLTRAIADEARAAFNAGADISISSTHSKDVSIPSDKRSLKLAFAKAVRGDSMTEVEKRVMEDARLRALGKAVTTSDTEYTAPTVDVDGLNNGGIFIPSLLVLDILKEAELVSAFAQDCLISNLKGVLKFPYKKYNSVPKTKAENKAGTTGNEDASFEWALLELKTYNQTITVPVTYELLAQAIDEFADYLIGEIAQAIREATNEEFLYGTGEEDHLIGATIGAIEAVIGGYEAGKELEALEAGIRKIPKRKKKGSKIYVASDVFKTIIFAKNANSDYIFNPFNSTELKTFATLPLVEDEMLKDGEFLIGNAKMQKLNLIKGILIEEEKHPKQRRVEYSSHVMIAGAPEPSSFVHGKKKTA